MDLVPQILKCPKHKSGKMWYLADGYYGCNKKGCDYKTKLIRGEDNSVTGIKAEFSMLAMPASFKS